MNNKPFLKWAGGKFRLVDTILAELPEGNRFVEPFAGSAAIYLNVFFKQALICDLNADLIQLYKYIQEDGEDFIAFCQSFFIAENNNAERYYEIRAQFNSAIDPRLRGALLLYLNRHGYNGLVRYNAKGGFNTPFGQYKKPYFPLKEMQVFYTKTKQIKTKFAKLDFRETFAMLEPYDIVYCDPPYVPLSNTANFTSYAGNIFGIAEQIELANLAFAASKKGITVIISNHNTELTRQIYASAEIKYFDVPRLISCKGNKRHSAAELLAIYKN